MSNFSHVRLFVANLCTQSISLKFLTSLFVLVPLHAYAHHSGSNFDRTKQIELSGYITDYGFRNPHVYIEVVTKDVDGAEQLWLIEGHSVTGARRLGWTRDSLQKGEQVRIIANPDRNSEKKFAILNSINKEDGSSLYAFRKPASEITVEPEQITPSQDFSGTWDLDLKTFNFLAANGQPPESLSLTEKGQEQRNRFKVEDNPALNCETVGVPRMVVWPYGYNFSREDDRVLIEKEHEAITRTIFLNRSLEEALLDDSSSNNSIGISVGRFESPRHLVVETAGFSETPWGLSSGLDSSHEKKVIENYLLSDDGLSIEVSYRVEDTEYLNESINVTGRYVKTKDREFAVLPCDLETANRHATE